MAVPGPLRFAGRPVPRLPHRHWAPVSSAAAQAIRRRCNSPPLAEGWRDNSEGVSRLVRPGAKSLLLRPPGWGVSQLLRDLQTLLRGGDAARSRFSDGTWIGTHRRVLLRQPPTPTLLLDGSAPFADLRGRVEGLVNADANGSRPGPGTDREGGDIPGMVRALAAQQGRRWAVLVDAYDESDDPAAMNDLISSLAAMLEAKDGVGMLLVAGTFRLGVAPASPTADAENIAPPLHGLASLSDLTLDFQHNSTAGRVLLPTETGESESESAAGIGDHQQPHGPTVRYRWSDRQQRPIRISTAGEVRQEAGGGSTTGGGGSTTGASNDGGGGGGGGGGRRDEGNRGGEACAGGWCGRGYWYGGFRQDGERELVAPFREALWDGLHESRAARRLRLFDRSLTEADLHSLVSSVTRYRPLEEYAGATFTSAGAETPCLAALWLQAGLLTIGSRSLLFHEFHTYAYLRLALPSRFAIDATWRALEPGTGGGVLELERIRRDATARLSDLDQAKSAADLTAGLLGLEALGCELLKTLSLGGYLSARSSAEPEGSLLASSVKLLTLLCGPDWRLENHGRDVVLEGDPVDSFTRTNDHLDPNPDPVTFLGSAAQVAGAGSVGSVSKDGLVFRHRDGAAVWEGPGLWRYVD